MATIVRPSRLASFSDLAKVDPRHFPADRIDAQIQNLIEAIHSTQVALADIRRDDGQLRMPQAQVRERAELEQLEAQLLNTSAAVASSARAVSAVGKDVHLRVQDAETAAFAAVKSLAEVERQGATARDAFDDAENAADRSEFYATQSQNSANYATAQSDNAIHANNEATQWAEYLAGPVVNQGEAPAYIQDHPFGHGLYYQPVEGGLAGLWSAKWWALYAQQLVGSWNFYYLGSWPTPPVPGSTNPATGIKVPSPLAVGSFYYNTTLNQLFIWDGTQWRQPFVQVLTPGYANSFTYVASAGQTVFSGPDSLGKTPVVGLSPSDVHVAGLRLVYTTQYTVNPTTNVLTLVTPATAGQRVQWDLLTGIDDTLDLGITIRKVTILPLPDGSNTTFHMTWVASGGESQAVDVTGGPQLQVSLDGIVQEPGIDFVASGDVLTMGSPPPVNSRFWGVWYSTAAAEEIPVYSAPVNTTLPFASGSLVQGSVLATTHGIWTGDPVPVYSYQWKRNISTNIGTNTDTYTTVTADIGSPIACEITALNSQGSAVATSNALGPIVAADTTPNVWVFAPVTDAALSTFYVSNPMAVSGINMPSPMTVTGGDYSKNGGAYVNTATNAVSGDSIVVRAMSSASNSTTVSVTLTIGGASVPFNVTTLAPSAVAPANTDLPAISGQPYVDYALTSSTGTWTGVPTPTYAYQWMRAGDVPANTTAPSVTGTAMEGQTLTCSTGTWTGNPVLAFEWRRDGAAFGVTTTTYVLTTYDVDTVITCVVTGTNGFGSVSATSNAVGPVLAIPVAPSNTVAPSIVGDIHVPSTMTALPGTWTGTPVPTLTYQWIRTT